MIRFLAAVLLLVTTSGCICVQLHKENVENARAHREAEAERQRRAMSIPIYDSPQIQRPYEIVGIAVSHGRRRNDALQDLRVQAFDAGGDALIDIQLGSAGSKGGVFPVGYSAFVVRKNVPLLSAKIIRWQVADPDEALDQEVGPEWDETGDFGEFEPTEEGQESTETPPTTKPAAPEATPLVPTP